MALPSRFHPLFDALQIPRSAYPYSTNAAARHALNPLISANSFSEFCFERNQYIALGDAAIARAITKEVTGFFLRRGGGGGDGPSFNVSHNTVRHISACFHNALSVRFVAEAVLPVAAVAAAEEKHDGTTTTTTTITDIFSAAHTPRRGPMSGRDRRDTSFNWNPHAYAQCDLAPRLSHFFGCIQLFCPPNSNIAVEAARRAFFNLDSEHGSNIPYEAAKLLATLCDRYAPANVAQALLAAQGLRVDFMCRSIGGGRGASSSSSSFSAQAAAAGGGFSPEPKSESMKQQQQQQQQKEEAKSLVRNASGTDSNALSSSLGQPPKPIISPSSHALGPGRVDLISKWHNAVASLKQRQEQQQEDTAVDNFGAGWKAPDTEASSFFSSSSSSSSTSFGLPSQFKTSVADVNGVPPPADLSQSHYVAKRKQNTSVRDPSFFDKVDAASGKDGVPLTNSPVVLSTGGGAGAGAGGSSSLQEYQEGGSPKPTTRDVVDALSHPHTRLFEVVIVRDPLVFSSTLRKEIYADDAASKDVGQGKAIADLTRERLFRFGRNGGSSGSEMVPGFGDEEEAARTPSVGPRVVARGMGTSYGEARSAAALNVLEQAVTDLAGF